MKNAFLVKIIPPKGYVVHRLEFTWRHLAALVATVVLVGSGVLVWYLWMLRGAQAQAHDLSVVTNKQGAALGRMDKQAEALDDELHHLRQENRQLRRMFGAPGSASAAQTPAPATGREGARRVTFDRVADRLEGLQRASAGEKADEEHLRRMAFKILNVRHIADLARAEAIAAIPSINPIPGSDIASRYGWRVSPWPEFHKGVDLDADYGTAVHAAAAGTVAAAGYDGGYGNKVDIDHGNGYHTWYCHLERVDVHVGERVAKTQEIALVGATGEATGPHLHYQVMFAGNPIDPEPFLTGVPPKVLASLH